MTAWGCRGVALWLLILFVALPVTPFTSNIHTPIRTSHLLAFFSETGLNCDVFPAATYIRDKCLISSAVPEKVHSKVLTCVKDTSGGSCLMTVVFFKFIYKLVSGLSVSLFDLPAVDTDNTR